MEAVRGKQDPPLHYGVGGMLSGFAAGGLVSLIRSEPFRFCFRSCLPGALLLGSAGWVTGLGERYLEEMNDRSRTRAASTLRSMHAPAAALGNGSDCSAATPSRVVSDERSWSEKVEDYVADFIRRNKK
jgi:hypothetical protein